MAEVVDCLEASDHHHRTVLRTPIGIVIPGLISDCTAADWQRKDGILLGAITVEKLEVLRAFLPKHELVKKVNSFTDLQASSPRPLSNKEFNFPRKVIVMDSETIAEQIPLLEGETDNYDGVTVTMKDPMDAQVFTDSLKASLSHWKEQGKKGIWIKLPLNCANLVEAAVSEGFRYHHAEPDYLMLVTWISQTPDTIPANASHIVGIGALVFNNTTGEVLVVQERTGYFKDKNVWKLPTGVVDEGIVREGDRIRQDYTFHKV
ncbi:unnamed protein product [Microthlaspi erraticum]|uniref:Nudix hydrolase n=1 Tax=Microthlaspi erraticum TaxID=1685480 RepID=A0A6D2HK84_9BRAS|nr:unnamed protein product [Microthlaspi erraticum]